MGFDLVALGLKLIDKVLPDKEARAQAQLELVRLTHEGELKQLEAEMAISLKQADITLEEAKSPSLFISGGRPAAIWVCSAALAYQFVILPLGTWAYILYTGHAPAVQPPTLDDNLWELVTSLLGLAGWRSFDKKNGVASR